MQENSGASFVVILVALEKFKMADCSLDELLAEVGNLSISNDCSRTIKDSKVRLGQTLHIKSAAIFKYAAS